MHRIKIAAAVLIFVCTLAAVVFLALPFAYPAAADGPTPTPVFLLNPCTHRPFTIIMTAAGIVSARVITAFEDGNHYGISLMLADNDEAKRLMGKRTGVDVDSTLERIPSRLI